MAFIAETYTSQRSVDVNGRTVSQAMFSKSSSSAASVPASRKFLVDFQQGSFPANFKKLLEVDYFLKF